MKPRAVIAIGLIALLITASVSGYMVYNQSLDNDGTTVDAAHKTDTGDARQTIDPDPTNGVGGADVSEDMAVDYNEASDSAISSDSDAQYLGASDASNERGAESTPKRLGDDIDQSTQNRANDAIKQILSKARSHKPRSGQNCKSATTPAVHRASGVRYNFPHDCLPKGWVHTPNKPGPNR